MIPLLLFVLLGVTILVLFEYRARHTSASPTSPQQEEANTAPEDGECCGQHLVCERETLLQTDTEIIYYDDEELDALAGKDAADYTAEQVRMIREVFDTLKESDVPGWVRSLQMRNIQLPMDVREEALFIVVERRKH